MLIWLRNFSKKKKLPIYSWLFWAALYPCIYFNSFTAEAGDFIKYAQEGETDGANDISLAATDAAQNGQNDFNSMGWHASSSQTTQLESYYTPGGVGLSGGTALNTYASTEGSLLTDTSCPSGFPSASSSVAQYQSFASVCQQRYAAFYENAQQLINSDPSNYATFNGVVSGLQTAWQSAFSSGESTVKGVASDCSQAPSCNLVTPTQVDDTTSLWSNTTTGFPGLQAYCESLPVDPGQDYSTLEQEATDLSSVAANLESITYQDNAVQDLYNSCTYGISYKDANMGTGGLNGYTNGTSTYDTTMNMSTFLNTTEGEDLENSMMPMIEGNSSVFSQYYSPSDCTSSTTYFTNGTTTVTTPSTTGINSQDQTTAAACEVSGLSSWVTDFPDANAQFIWGGNTGCSTISSSASSENFEASYNNGGNGTDTGTPISADLYFAIDGSGTLSIENSETGDTQSFNYNDNGESPSVAYPPDGWLSESVTIEPGLNVVTITDSPTSSTEPAGAIASIINTANNDVILDTNSSQWNWMNATAPASSVPVTATTTSGTTESTGSPSASATSDICTGMVLRCLGTECHGLINNQNLDFNKAVTASSALEMMQTNMQCEAGTSVAAGNCIPIIFQGKYDYCRNWPIAGNTFTNNCCKLNLSGSAPALSKYIGIIMDSYAASASPILENTILGDPAMYADKAYSIFSTWGEQAWNFVSGPFVGVAQSLMQDLGLVSQTTEATIEGVGAGVGADAGVGVGATGASSTGVLGSISHYIDNFEGELKQYAIDAIKSISGNTIGTAAATTIVDDVIAVADVVMLAYTIFQIAQLIGQLLTSCKQEEYALSTKRQEHDCDLVGSYCATKSFIGCLETKTTFCCYQSPLAEIIASQIRNGQPGVAGSYTSDYDGTDYSVKSPDCAGFTPQQLTLVNWNDVNLSAWLALLEQAGMIQTSNQAAAADYNANAEDHPSSYVNPSEAG